MKIKFNKVTKTIEINDGLKSHYFLIKTLLIITSINAVLNLYDITKRAIGFMEIIWLLLGIFSLTVLYSLVFKESTLEKIPLKNINSFKEKTLFGKKQYFLELISGKRRPLKDIKSEKDLKDLRKLLKEAGVKT